MQVLADAPANDGGGSWSPDGRTILFGGRNPNWEIRQVPAAGGTAVPVLKFRHGETLQRWPRFLPDGKSFLYFSTGKSAQDTGIVAASLDGKNQKLLVSSPFAGEFADGYLVYRAEEALAARPFDPGTLQFSGEPVQILPAVSAIANGRIAASITAGGYLVANEGAADGSNVLTWVDRSGKQLATVGQPGTYNTLSLSPDGRQLVFTSNSILGDADVWGIDLTRNVSTRVTFDAAPDSSPIWAADGRTILFASQRKGSPQVYRKPSSGLGEEQPLAISDDASTSPLSVSPDGKWLLFATNPGTGDRDVFAVPLLEKGEPVPVLNSPFDESWARFSPDGRWIAYMSNESGKAQVYVRSFPGSERKLQVSTTGGTQPRWRRDGRELYYLGADASMMAVTIKLAAPFELGDTKALFPTNLPVAPARSDYDVAADGSRFILNRPIAAEGQTSLTVVQNWQALLK